MYLDGFRARKNERGYLYMRWITASFVSIVILVALPHASFADHEIMKWRNNASSAVSITFDDGYYSQPTDGADLLNAYFLKGTFFLTIESLDWTGTSWEMWQDVAAQGHEVGSHTVTHPYLTSLSEGDLREELSDSQETIELNIPSQYCLTLAYPYGDYNDFVKDITSEYYIAAREVWSPGYLNHYPGGSFDPVDFFAIGSFDFDSSTHDQILDYLDSAETYNAWFVVHIHEIDQDVNSDRYNRLTAFLDELLIRDIWVDTLGTVVRYMQETMYSSFVVSESQDQITLNLTNSLDDDMYNVPLTIRSTVPLSWSEVEISQAASVHITEPVIVNDEAVIYYNVTPNAGLITLTPSSPSTQPSLSLNPVSLTASTFQGSNAQDQTFDVWNSGVGTLNYSISTNETWLSCIPATGSSEGEQDIITVSYSTSSLAPGSYSAAITVSDSNADNSPQIIPVSLAILDAFQPNISTSPSSLTASATQGTDPPDQSFDIANSGGGTLNYSISSDQPWLSCTPVSGSCDGETDTITVSYLTSSLAPGSYSAIITVTDPAAANSPLTIPVTLTIEGVYQSILELNFEEGSGVIAFDTSGNNNHASIDGAVYTSDAASGSYALSFDGTNDRASCQGNLSLMPYEFSVSLWVTHTRDTTSPGYGGIIQGAYGNGYSSGFRILDYNNAPLAQINFGDSSPVRILGQPFVQNDWCHLVLTYDHISIKLYQNGLLVTEIPQTRDIFWDPQYDIDFYIGWAQWFFAGIIDQVLFFDYPLTDLEIQQLYSGQ
jgi:peptidoglycan/xylan/chitin deacetylase (PgdA/CDA1 family)